MKQFSKLNTKLNKNDFIYSEITALAYMNPEFFNFLSDERWKYLTQNSVLNNALTFEYDKCNIIINKNIIEISIEEHWNFLKDCYKIAMELKNKIPDVTKIIVDDKALSFISGSNIIVLRDKFLTDMITQVEKSLGIELIKLYNKNIDSLIDLFFIHLKTYLKPLYLEGLKYFMDIFYEKQLDLNWSSYKNFKVNGLGYRMDTMPKLYYNNLADYCKDLILIPDAFREYNLFIDSWKDIKNINLNKEYLLPLLKDKISEDSFLFLVSKYYSLSNKDYYNVDRKCNLLHLPSIEEFKKTFTSNYIISYKTNDEKDLIICVNWGEIELRLKISIGLAPYDFFYSIDIIENKRLKNLD